MDTVQKEEPANTSPPIPSKRPTSGFSIASLVLGIISFFPILGFLAGIGAIITGIIGVSKTKNHEYGGKGMAIAGIVIGIIGIFSSAWVFAFYFLYQMKSGPFAAAKKPLTKQALTLDVGYLETYKKKYGEYPETLGKLEQEFNINHDSILILKPFCYKQSENGESYTLESSGPDGICWNSDDILPNQ